MQLISFGDNETKLLSLSPALTAEGKCEVASTYFNFNSCKWLLNFNVQYWHWLAQNLNEALREVSLFGFAAEFWL